MKKFCAIILLLTGCIPLFAQNSLFPDKPTQQSDVTITLVKTYGQYIRYQHQSGVEVRKSGGYFSTKNKEVVTYTQGNHQFPSVCYHELCHYLTHKYIERPPVWLNEGLATYFEAVNVGSKKVTIKENSQYKARVKTLLELRDINLKEFINWNYKKFYDISFSNEAYGYAVSYCIVKYLLTEKENVAHNMIKEIAKSTSSEEAFKLHYPGGIEQFEQDFIAYYT